METQVQDGVNINQAWFDDFDAGCSQAAHLYATAFDRMVIELGDQAAFALAPVVLRDVVSLGQEHANRVDAQRMQAIAAQRAQEEETSYFAALEARQQQAQNPW